MKEPLLDVTKVIDYKKNEMILIYSANIYKTVDEILSFCEINLGYWEVKEQITNKWGNEDNPKYKVKIKLKGEIIK